MGVLMGEEWTYQVTLDCQELRGVGTKEKNIMKDDSQDVKRGKMTSQVRKAKAITLCELHAEGWLLKGGLNALDQSAMWIKGLWDLITSVLKNGPANVTLS